MNLSDIPHWNDRIEAMKDFDQEWIRIIQGIQSDVWQEIIRYFVQRVTRNDKGDVANATDNLLMVAGIDRIVSAYMNAEVVGRVINIGREVDKLLGVNKAYYAAQATITDRAVNAIATRARNYALEYIGGQAVNLGIKIGSMLWEAIMDTRFTRSVKAILMNSISTEKPVNRTVKEIEHFGESNTNKQGEYEKQVYNVLPDPGGVIEDVYGLQMAIEIGMHFARYQGGIIKTSRPFCIERNNKIFHVSQIAKFGTPDDEFGGYTNKSIGQFAGKYPVYNPFYDLGGYNCRHRYFYIGKAYAERVDPSLKGRSWDLPEIFKKAA